LITSKQNASFKLWQKLKLKKYRDMHDMFLVYGDHQITKAKEKGALLEVLSTDEKFATTVLSKELMDDLQQAETYFDRIGLCKKTNPKIQSKQILLLDDVQDPDNLGALIRSAAAFNFLHIILSHKSADAYNEKAIRAAKGSLFDVYLERRPLHDAISDLKMKGYTILCADAHQKGELQKFEKVALVLGNEGHGISDEIKSVCDLCVTIETNHVESLNVSVAGAILMYEWRKL
jgi:TrmH family RNA methyltransferase